MERRDGDAALAADRVGPNGGQVAGRRQLVRQRRRRPRRRHAACLAIHLGREEVLDRVDEELLGLADVHAPATEVVEAGGVQALQRAMDPCAGDADLGLERAHRPVLVLAG